MKLYRLNELLHGPGTQNLSFSLILYDSSSKENIVIAFSIYLLSSMCLRFLIYKKGILYVSCACVLNRSVVYDCSPMDCSPLGFSVLGILEATILEWVAISFFRESSWPRDRTHIFSVFCIGRQILYHWVTWEYDCFNESASIWMESSKE